MINERTKGQLMSKVNESILLLSYEREKLLKHSMVRGCTIFHGTLFTIESRYKGMNSTSKAMQILIRTSLADVLKR